MAGLGYAARHAAVLKRVMVSWKVSSLAPVQAVVRTIYPYGSIATVRRGPLRGRRIVVSPAMGVSFIWNRQPRDWAWLNQISAGACIYDIGANAGQSAMRFSQVVGHWGRVVSFEPSPISFRTLCRNISLNGLHQIKPIEAAVGETNGTAEFVEGAAPTQGHLVGPGGPGHRKPVKVRMVSLDSYADMGLPRPQFLKIDVEGTAAGVLAGGANLIRSARPHIYIELHGQAEQDAVDELKETFGYLVHDMSGRIITQPRTAHYCGPLICRPN